MGKKGNLSDFGCSMGAGDRQDGHQEQETEITVLTASPKFDNRWLENVGYCKESWLMPNSDMGGSEIGTNNTQALILPCINTEYQLRMLQSSINLKLVSWTWEGVQCTPIKHLWDVVEKEICFTDVRLTNLQQLCHTTTLISTKIWVYYSNLVEFVPWRRWVYAQRIWRF